MDIRRGDKLVTSGIDGVYPTGLAVAIVTQIDITPDSPFARIICIPTGGVENHRQVLLVSMPPIKELPIDEVLIDPNQSVTNQSATKPAPTMPIKGQEKLIEKTKQKNASTPEVKPKPAVKPKPVIKPETVQPGKPHA